VEWSVLSADYLDAIGQFLSKSFLSCSAASFLVLWLERTSCSHSLMTPQYATQGVSGKKRFWDSPLCCSLGSWSVLCCPALSTFHVVSWVSGCLLQEERFWLHLGLEPEGRGSVYDFFFFLMALGFELRASCLRGRHFIMWTILSAQFMTSYFLLFVLLYFLGGGWWGHNLGLCAC
jgi:hypothetical protein